MKSKIEGRVADSGMDEADEQPAGVAKSGASRQTVTAANSTIRQAYYEVPIAKVSDAFVQCWRAAGTHLQRQGQGAINWLRAELGAPLLEHLSFRLGNQLFFVCLDADEVSPFSDANAKALTRVAAECRGHACIMPLRKTPSGWVASSPGWGLVDVRSRRPIDPPALITEEKIEMTQWELQDFAVQIVRQRLEKEGRKVLSWQSDPEVDPSLWFEGDEGSEWVVVRVVRYPRRAAPLPSNWQVIVYRCAAVSSDGHFASVTVANANDPFDPVGSAPIPLWRGHGLVVRYEGLVDGPNRA